MAIPAGTHRVTGPAAANAAPGSEAPALGNVRSEAPALGCQRVSEMVTSVSSLNISAFTEVSYKFSAFCT